MVLEPRGSIDFRGDELRGRRKIQLFRELLILAIVCFSWRTHAAPGQPLPRHILGLYDSKLVEDIYFTRIHQRAEIWLNHLGLIVDYHDLKEELPDLDPKEYRAVLSWHPSGYTVPQPREYCSWLEENLRKGIRIVILGEMGLLPKNSKLDPTCEQALHRLGLEYLYNFSDNPFFFEITFKDSRMVEFERSLLLSEGLEYQQVKAIDPRSRVYLKMRRRDFENSDSDVVFTNPQGGFAMDTFVNYRMAENEKVQWRLHPYYFFEAALGIADWPKPDTTTLKGKRIYFSHIDGDGLFNLSLIDQKSYSGTVILNEILRKHPKLPVTASIIAGYLDMPQYATERELALYRDIFSLPNVEPAVHGYAHPLVWKTGKVSLDVPGYRFSPTAEVIQANRKLNDLLVSLNLSKKSRLTLWTGDCMVTTEALDAAIHEGLLNLNGGGGRNDAGYESVSYLFPLSRMKEGRRQIYAAFSNENVFTNLWHGPYYGFSRLIESYQNTESPFRLKPLNLYYHYYSGERLASLNALKEILAYVEAQDVTPIFASQYAAIVGDFFTMKMHEVKEGYWLDHPTDGGLRTVRFDHEKRRIDWVRSRGIEAVTTHQGNLYVSLGAGSHHEIYFKK